MLLLKPPILIRSCHICEDLKVEAAPEVDNHTFETMVHDSHSFTIPSVLTCIFSSILEEGVDEGEEEEEEVPTLADALAQLGLTDLTERFTKEMIDFDSFVSLVVNSKIATHSICDSPVVEIKDYSVVHFDCIAVFKKLYRRTSTRGGAHIHLVGESCIYEASMSPTRSESSGIQCFKHVNMGQNNFQFLCKTVTCCLRRHDVLVICHVQYDMCRHSLIHCVTVTV